MNSIIQKFFKTCVSSFGKDCDATDADGFTEVKGLAGPVLASGFKPGKQSGICIRKNVKLI
jgi:hypothetical protein